MSMVEETPITIHPELQSLIPPLTPEEYAQLEANILLDGCHDPLILWQEEHILLDGHNRYAICTRHGLPYTTQEVSLSTLDAARAWMVDNQLGRRNLTPEQSSYFRGKQYELRKNGARGGGDRKSTEARNQNPQSEGNDTAAVLARHHKVGKSTIERDASYARAVDTIADAVGVEARQAILARDTRLSHQEVKTLAMLAPTDPQTVTQVIETVQTAPTRKAAKTQVAQVLAPVACGICGKLLTDPDSVQRGIGPICAGHDAASSAPGMAATGATAPPSARSADVVPDLPLPTHDELYAEVHDEIAAEIWEAVRCVVAEVLQPLTVVLGLAPFDEELDGIALVEAHVTAALERLAVPLPARASKPTTGKAAKARSKPTRRAHGSLTERVKVEAQGQGRFTCRMIADALGEQPKAVWRVLQGLKDQGLVRHDEATSEYVWPE